MNAPMPVGLEASTGGRDTPEVDAVDLLRAAMHRSRAVRGAVAERGHLTLESYMRDLAGRHAVAPSRHADLLDVVGDYTGALLGEAVAGRVRRALERHPLALTTNHHGVDYFAQSVQGSLIFSLLGGPDGVSVEAVPVFACGAVPLDNLTYPQGLLAYGCDASPLGGLPRRVPVFSNRHRRELVSVVRGFDGAMVARARDRLARNARDGLVAPRVAEAGIALLEDLYGDPEVLDLPTYSEQAVLLNHRIWRLLAPDRDGAPDLVYLELERVAALLAERDLADPESLCHQVLFEPRLRDLVVEALDGARACWHRYALASRLEPEAARAGRGTGGCGTLFFWGVTDSGRRVPLDLVHGEHGDTHLHGIDDAGREWRWPYSPEAIAEGLQRRRLLPSLFTCFLEVAFTRGLLCLGGYHQTDYLAAMQRGLVFALLRAGRERELIDEIASVPTDGYLAGMQTAMHRTAEGYLVPAGPLEILAAGGLAADDLARARALPVRDAHLASLFETIPDLAPDVPLPEGWREGIGGRCTTFLLEEAA